jgi:hypothetical protein
MELDLEDFLEEVKFQMTEYDRLEKEIILDWEAKARQWVETHKDKKYITYKAKDDIQIKIKDEDIMFDIALKFYQAVKKDQIQEYWKTFQLI